MEKNISMSNNIESITMRIVQTSKWHDTYMSIMLVHQRDAILRTTDGVS